MSQQKEILWVGRAAHVFFYCIGVFWIFALVANLQALFDITNKVNESGIGQLIGYSLAN